MKPVEQTLGRLFRSYRGFDLETAEGKREYRFRDLKPAHRVAGKVVWSLPVLTFGLMVLEVFLFQAYQSAWRAFFDVVIGFFASILPFNLLMSAVAAFWLSDVVVGLLLGVVFWVLGSLPFRPRSLVGGMSGMVGSSAFTILSVTGYFVAKQAWLTANILGSPDGSRYAEAGRRFAWLIWSSAGVMAGLFALMGRAGYRWGLRAYPDADRSAVRNDRSKPTAPEDLPPLDDSWKPFGDAVGSGR